MAKRKQPPNRVDELLDEFLAEDHSMGHWSYRFPVTAMAPLSRY